MTISRQRGLAIAFGSACVAATTLLACEEDATTPSPIGSDAAVADTGTAVPSKDDAATLPADAGDAGPVVTTDHGSTGYVRIESDSAFCSFFEDDTIVRWLATPECVLHTRSENKPYSAAGEATLGGVTDVDGGIVRLSADPATYGSNQYIYPSAVFAPTAEPAIQFALAESPPGFPAITVQTLHPRAALVTLTSPPDLDMTMLSATQPLQVTWTAPTGVNVASQRLIMELDIIGSALGSRHALLSCNFPLSAGTATIPANVFEDTKAQVRAGDAAGALTFQAGGYVRQGTGGVSYILEAVKIDSTSWPSGRTAKIQ